MTDAPTTPGTGGDALADRLTIARPLVRPGIMDIAPYVPGGQSLAGHSRVIRLASNENPLGTGPLARAALARMSDKLHLYPDGDAAALRNAIGEAHGIDPAYVVCGTGSDELIGLIARGYAGLGNEILFPAHGFLMYRLSAMAVGATPVAAAERDCTTDVDALLGAVTERTRIVYVANPNNPTGTWIDSAEMARLRAELPERVLLVIDSAYAEYMDQADYDDGASLVTASIGGHENTVMLRTFSKIHGLAALRVGWGYFPPTVAAVLNRIRGPFNVNAAGQVAATAAVTDIDFVNRSKAHNDEWRPWLAGQITDLGMPVVGDAGNFVLARFDSADRATAALQALADKGIIVRPVVPYGLPDCLRITVGLADENQAVVDALKAFVET